MMKEMQDGRAQARLSKSIPELRDRRQSDLLVGVVGMLLVDKAAVVIWQLHGQGALPAWFW